MKHFEIIFKPENKEIYIHENATILEAAGKAGIILNTSCGAKGICRKCIVNINPEDQEVLACQYKIKNDLIVTIPQKSRFFEPKILETGIENPTKVSFDIYHSYSRFVKDKTIFGIAIDIGTTTIVAKLIDLFNAKVFATKAALNPQIKFGDDVISRITYAYTDEKLYELHDCIIDCLNTLIDDLCQIASIGNDQIFEICVVGNTTMNHIFLKYPVNQIGYSPYQAYSLEAKDSSPSALNLKINHAGNIRTLENISGFVGSDTIAVALATDIDSSEKITLMIDIGTNGEIILGNKEKLYAASCAAGPAFEGARISCGSRASNGSIESVFIKNNEIDFDVIGNIPAQSICGSGLIDVVAIMLELGIIDKTGRFVDNEILQNKLPETLYQRLRKVNNEPAFFLAESVYISQKDVRQLQLAKAAILAGIKLLINELNIQNNDIEQVYLAGAFGNYISKENALKIGLLPAISPEKIHFIGNAAESGAEMALVSRQYREKTKQLAQKIEYFELAISTDFPDIFAECISF